MVLCKCGCGKETKLYRGKYRDYIHNHHMIGKKLLPHSEERKVKISKKLKGRKLPQETIEKMKLNRVGMKNKHHSQTTKDKISKNRKNKCCGINHYLYGKSLPEEIKKRISDTVSKNENLHSRIAENNPNWNGGTSFEPYCYKFNKKLKESIRKRDNYQCQHFDCLVTQLENLLLHHQALHVHHIHYKKEDCDPDLITLCSSHNLRANKNRDYWENIYMKVLEKRGLCKPL